MIIWLLRLSAITLLVIMFSGCQTGRRWFRMDSDSRTPSMGIELRTQQPAPTDTHTATAGTTSQPAAVATTALPQTAEEKPRRRLPDWLRLGKDDEPVPLPTTAPTEASTAATSVAGPDEEFQ